MIIWLDVPFAEKDMAKQRGAKWDSARRKWFVENVNSFTPYLKWMNSDDRRAYATQGIGELCSSALSSSFERAIGRDD